MKRQQFLFRPNPHSDLHQRAWAYLQACPAGQKNDYIPCLLYGFIDLLYRMGILHREITDMCLSVPCPAAVSALFPFVGIEKRQPFFPAVPCRQFVRFCCDKGPFCTDLKTALCSRYGANDYLSFIMIFSGATFSVI